MKWTAKIGTFTAKRCGFCEYWIGARPKPILNSYGMYQYDTHCHGICRHPLYRSRDTSADATCGHFEQYMHLH